MVQSLVGIDLNLWISILVVSVFTIAVVFYRSFSRWLAGNRAGESEDNSTLDKAISAAGYYYDSGQDIFCSGKNSWQKDMGYCRLYDEAAAPLSMIIDCEPVYFEYDGKRWLIEFWKGQYGMTTGGEIGVYTTEGPDISIPGFFNGTFYYCASNADMLRMSYSLAKNGEVLFRRKGRHWWLTGFKLGEFSEPSELVMYLNIALKDETMRDAFVEGLKKTGYSENEIYINGNAVDVVFDRARSPQPVTRTAETDWLTQRKNELLCDKYQKITGPYDNFPDKMNAVRKKAPEIYAAISNIGRNKQVFEVYERIKAYLSS